MNLINRSVHLTGRWFRCNNDGSVNLQDAISGLQLLIDPGPPGIRSAYVPTVADIDGDQKIGLPEIIYILQKIAVMR